MTIVDIFYVGSGYAVLGATYGNLTKNVSRAALSA